VAVTALESPPSESGYEVRANTKTPVPYVSTGRLPPPGRVTTLVDEAYERFKSNSEGEPSRVYPALARVSGDLFSISVASTNGNFYSGGGSDVEFPIMSVSKPFVFAFVSDQIGFEEVREKVGAKRDRPLV
jgi:glutaminase